VTDQRNRVWNFLNSKELSKLVIGADLTIQSEFGKRRKNKSENYMVDQKQKELKNKRK
jgi:hypothetical protein